MFLTPLQRRWLRITGWFAAIGMAWATWHFVIEGDVSPTYIIPKEETTWTTTSP